MIITFSGHNGAGKTAVSKELAEQLGFAHFNAGTFMREDAKRRGMTIEEHAHFLKDHPEIDHELDEWIRGLGKKDDIIVDARTAWHFIPHSKKVFLTADEDVRVQRAFDGARDSEKYASVDEAREKLQSRIDTIRNNLRNLYGIDVYNPENFDLIIDTSDKSIKEVVEVIHKELQV